MAYRSYMALYGPFMDMMFCLRLNYVYVLCMLEFYDL